MPKNLPLNDRRQFLQGSIAAGALMLTGDWSSAAAKSRKKLPVAAIVTEYRVNSHADVIVGKILEGYQQDGGAGPDLQIVSMFTDQVPKSDKSRALANQHGFRIAKNIEEAITLGTGKISVAGVLSIGEHGNYPYTPDTKQHKYPRRRFFDGIVATFKKYDTVVPVFSDKHLSYNWKDAKHIYDVARRMQIPFMAGSSVPVAWRIPALTLPLGCKLDGAMALGYGGLESYAFHALEGLQCMVERRGGGESGVASVQAVTGEEIFKAEKAGRWSRELFDAAVAATAGGRRTKAKEISKKAVFYLIEYRDGLKAALAMNTGLASEFAFATKVKGEPKPQATWFALQEGKPYLHFEHLVRAIEHMIHTGKPAYPVERTLLTTGVLDAALHSAFEGHKLKKTGYLDIQYKPSDWSFAKGTPPKPRANP